MHLVFYLILFRLILYILLPINPIYAGVLNVITDSDSAIIKVNKQIVARGVLTNHILDQGSYYVEVIDNNAKLYSKLERITTFTKTINVTSEQTPLRIESLEDSRKKAHYIFAEKSKFGVGIHLDYTGLINGLKLSYEFLYLDHQIIGIAYETDSNKFNSFKYRAIKYLNGRLKNTTYSRPYIGLGVGQSSSKHDSFSTNRTLYEAILGAQFGFLKPDKFEISPIDIAIGIICPPLFVIKKGSYFLGANQNLLFNIETGYTYRFTDTNNPEAWGNYKGIKVGADITYQF